MRRRVTIVTVLVCLAGLAWGADSRPSEKSATQMIFPFTNGMPGKAYRSVEAKVALARELGYDGVGCVGAAEVEPMGDVVRADGFAAGVFFADDGLLPGDRQHAVVDEGMGDRQYAPAVPQQVGIQIALILGHVEPAGAVGQIEGPGA